MTFGMRAESIPLLLGIAVMLIGALIIADAIFEDVRALSAERRHRARPERSPIGQILLGAGTLCIAAVLIGGDEWHYTTLAIAIAVVLVVIGVALNYRYIRGSLMGPVLGRSSKRRRGDRAERGESGESAPRP
jgi:drug/metabolite transporter (DMT)-like permease